MARSTVVLPLPEGPTRASISPAAQDSATSSGSAQGGLVAYSLVLAPQVRALGSFALVPAEWHLPLRQRMALMKTAGPVAREFFDYLRSPAARLIFRRHGFLIAGEQS